MNHILRQIIKTHFDLLLGNGGRSVDQIIESIEAEMEVEGLIVIKDKAKGE